MSVYSVFSKSQTQLVDNLMKRGALKSDKVRKALLSIDRADFTTIEPYNDKPQTIGFGATISAPHMHALALEHVLDLLEKDHAKVLDVGSGSGYLCAALAKMLGPNGKVVGIDHIPELVEMSEKNLRKHNADLLDSGKITLVAGDGRLGYLSLAPYDVIHVGAAANDVPKALIEQLAVNGRMLIPVGLPDHQDFVQIDKISPTEITQKKLFGVVYVPLTNKELQLKN